MDYLLSEKGWMLALELLLISKYGVSTCDLPAFRWSELYSQGLMPEEAIDVFFDETDADDLPKCLK